jgi:hypothetical protein
MHNRSASQMSNLKTSVPSEAPDFSLVLGGSLFRLYRRCHLSGDSLELVWRRILVLVLVAWLPLVLLSSIDHHLLGKEIKVPFLHDILVHVRFLVSLPLLISAEVIIRQRIDPLVRLFASRHIVATEDMPRFNAAIYSAIRARDSIFLEVIILILVYTVGSWITRSQLSLVTATWYATPDGQHLHLTPAGYWFVLISIPIFQFIILRWYMRLIIWYRLLWQIARLRLRLTAAHPDRAGGIGFLGDASYAFSFILFAQGALLSGMIASRVLLYNQNLMSFQSDAIGLVIFSLLLILGPLAMFTPQLIRAKYQGLATYGSLANRYLFRFEEKWIPTSTTEANELLGTSDIQSLADMGNSFTFVREMRIVPFDLEDVVWLAVAIAAPFLPLTLLAFSTQEIILRLLKIIFR